MDTATLLPVKGRPRTVTWEQSICSVKRAHGTCAIQLKGMWQQTLDPGCQRALSSSYWSAAASAWSPHFQAALEPAAFAFPLPCRWIEQQGKEEAEGAVAAWSLGAEWNQGLWVTNASSPAPFSCCAVQGWGGEEQREAGSRATCKKGAWAEPMPTYNEHIAVSTKQYLQSS